ncbi:MAG: hypothetical protein K0R80_1549 [Clostridia bacterium]|jgi:hypothetical protein|nr:hypothetical protein [Clostridia bacterium]
MKRKLTTVLLILALFISIIPVNALAAAPEGVPGKLEAPAIVNIELITGDVNHTNSHPIFRLEIKLPQSALDLDEVRPADGFANIEYFSKIDDGNWEKSDGGYMDNLIGEPSFKVPGKTNTFYAYVYPIDEGDMETIDIKNRNYSFKVQLYYQYYFGEDNSEWDYVYSDFSNEVSKGSASFYEKASSWAEPELKKAEEAGLIPAILEGADLTRPITREEFCELSVLLYEKTTGKKAPTAVSNPFTDTDNPQILKAYQLGITSGTSATTFSPHILITREQCAAMLFRAMKAIKPDGDYNIAGVKDFPDQKYISNWAVDATKYMSKVGIITGDTKGNFMPKASTTAQEAAGYGKATREQAIALSLRTYEKMK